MVYLKIVHQFGIDVGIWFAIIMWGHFSLDHITGNGIPLCKAAILGALNKARDWQKEIYSNILCIQAQPSQD